LDSKKKKRLAPQINKVQAKIQTGLKLSPFSSKVLVEKGGFEVLVWGDGSILGGEDVLRIPWGSGMAGSSPSSLKISSKDWEEIWRGGMTYCSSRRWERRSVKAELSVRKILSRHLNERF
jgi:hypothetical protein